MQEKKALKGSLSEASGIIRYTFLNNYMFISILEKNLDILKSLVCSLLHIENSKGISIEVLNPITYGDTPESKTFILDIKLKLEDKSLLNIEMQVNNYGDYNYRATQYLCRAYDNLLRGEDYINSHGAIHIGFLNYDLFEENISFYSRYMIKDVESGYVFNDRFDIRIISMNRIDLAYEEDKKYGIDAWVKLFKAKTWEELQMAATTMDMKNAAQRLYDANLSETEMYYAQAYEDFIRNEEHNKRIQADYERIKKELAEKDNMIADLSSKIADLEKMLAIK